MFDRMKGWIKDKSEWNEQHRRNWDRATIPASDGLSMLQRLLETRLAMWLADDGCEVVDRQLLQNPKGEYVVRYKVVPVGVDVWVFNAGVQAGIGEPELKLHDGDAISPDELAKMVVDFVKSKLPPRA
ncbi:MAG TPA: hypothetical protein VF980_01990 [Thermoanaerobaculia bacterium]